MIPSKSASIACFVGTVMLTVSSGNGQTFSWRTISPMFTGQLLSLAQDGNNLYLGDSLSVFYRSTDDGRTWVDRAPLGALSPAAVAETTIHPNGDVFLVTRSVSSGQTKMFRSHDKGVSWMAPQSIPSTTTGCLFISPTGRFLLGRAGAILASSDTGATWTFIASGLSGSTVLGISSTGPALVAATTRGIARSTDDGSNWSFPSGPPGIVHVSAVTRVHGDIVVSATDNGIFRSSDSGQSWVLVAASPVALSIAADSGGFVVAGISGGSIRISNDSGLTWSAVATGWEVCAGSLVVRGSGEAFAATNNIMYRSTDGGVQWQDALDGITEGQPRLARSSPDGLLLVITDSGALYRVQYPNPWWRTGVSGVLSIAGLLYSNLFVGTDSDGIYRSGDKGRTWSTTNSGLTDLHVHSVNQISNSQLFAGTGSGVFYSNDSGTTWSSQSFGLPSGAAELIGRDGEGTVFALIQGSGFYLSTNNGLQWQVGGVGLPSSLVTSIVSPGVGQVFAATNGAGIFKSTDHGSSWSALNSGLASLDARDLAVMSNGDLFTATSSGAFRLPGSSSQWVQENSGLPHLNVMTLAPTASGELLFSLLSDGLLTLGEYSSSIPPVFSPRWLAGGSLQNWYHPSGCEREEGWGSNQQQFGLRWPAIEPLRDAQAAKSLWIGTTSWTDQQGTIFPVKVVHVGPRVTGIGEFFPMKFAVIGRFPPPTVLVNGNPSGTTEDVIDSVDANILPDRLIINEVNTAIGVTMRRDIFRFSHKTDEGYIVQVYEFKNTGNVDDDPFIELPNQIVDSLYMFFQYEWAPCRATRYVIGNATGWGINTMLDTRGDSIAVDPPGEQFRAQYGWHARYPGFPLYDNVGAPGWHLPGSPPIPDPGDTVGRLGAAQFVGVVTLHADRSAADTTDDPRQPVTTTYEGSDDPLNFNNSQFYVPKMIEEYQRFMSKGHQAPRHWDLVGPQGDPSRGYATSSTSGGQNAGNGFGPYRLLPGETIRFVIAEAAAGLDRERCISVGSQYKQGLITAQAKNDSFYTGRDSLFKTFNRAIANHQTGYTLSPVDHPPSSFVIFSGDSSISLSWEPDPLAPLPDSFRVYRSSRLVWETPVLVASEGPSSRNFVDNTAEQGVAQFYFVTACYGDRESGRYYTQTYTPAFRGSLGVGPEDDGVPRRYQLYQNYPNPFNPSTTIAFDIPRSGKVTLKIYDVLGGEVTTLLNEDMNPGRYAKTFDGSGLASGVYFYRLQAGSFIQTKKLLLLR